MMEIIKYTGIAAAALAVVVAFLRWRLSRAKSKNKALAVDNAFLIKILKMSAKMGRKRGEQKNKLDEMFPRDGSSLNTADPWYELRERDKGR